MANASSMSALLSSILMTVHCFPASLILNWEEENNVRNKLEGMFDDEDVEEGQVDAVKKKKGYR